MSQESPIDAALELPGGARFRRCALRLRASADAAVLRTLVEACRQRGLEIVAVEERGDRESEAALEAAAQAAGLNIVHIPKNLSSPGGGLPALRPVERPTDLEGPDAWCWIKMSGASSEGLRQAALDPGSRIRCAGDPAPERHVELVAMTWQSGGFLGELAIRWNTNLNVLIGGRGAGKSTILESLRYVLDRAPLGDEAKAAHQGIVRNVLCSGTKISLLVRRYRPAEREYVIERTVPNPPVVRTRAGEVLDLAPSDVVPRAEIYGQHEIAELVRSPDKLTRLLERFTVRDDAATGRHAEIHRGLERTRRQILDVHRELAQVEDRLAALPALEETLQRFQEAGLEDKLKERSLLVREEQVLSTATERLAPFRRALEAIRRELPIDRRFLDPEPAVGVPSRGVRGGNTSLAAAPGQEILAACDPIFGRLEQGVSGAADRMASALADAEPELADVCNRWDERRAVVQEAYEVTLRELQSSQVDGAEFIRLRQQIEQLRPLKERQGALRHTLGSHTGERHQLLAEWEDAKAAQYRELERAAARVNEQLDGRVRVHLEYAGHREPLFQLLREHVGGRLSEALEALREHKSLSLGELVSACRAGREALIERFSVPPAQADRLSQASPDSLMEIEELDLASTTRIELNVGGSSESGQPAAWQPLDALSTGQKATAVLLLLLLESDSPLVVDQPEDDLDNRFIADAIVPKMREEKLRRQFVFATHNANIPVIGDAELILGLVALGEAGQVRARISPEHMGSIDTPSIQELVEEVLEGGRTAFETRRRKYGF